MMNAVAKSGHLSPYLKTTSLAAVNLVQPVVKPKPITSDNLVVPPVPHLLSSNSMSALLSRGKLSVRCGPCGATQVRLAHTDFKIPDFSAYRKDCTMDPTKKAEETEAARMNFTYVIAGASAITGLYSAKHLVRMFVLNMAPSADVLALASVEINLNEVPEGKSVTFKWRGKPLFIRHRTAQEIAQEDKVSLSELRDPQTDAERCQKQQFLVVIGVCTHLGCIPIANSGDFGGYYCPCHGSHYDASGRIRKGPAPLNLEVPPYSYLNESTLVVG